MVRPRGVTSLPRPRAAAVRTEALERRTLLATISGTAYRDADNDGTMDVGENTIFGMTIYQDLNGNNQYDPGTSEFGVNGNERLIPDPGTINVPLTVSGMPGNVLDVNVVVDISHPWVTDVTATLISPSGRSVLLFGNLRADEFPPGEDFQGTIFDDEAETPIEDGLAPYSLIPYQPTGELSSFDGTPMNGTWTLRVSDVDPGAQGFLWTWGLIFTGANAEPKTETDIEGNYQFTGLAAGTHRIRMVVPEGETQTQPANNGTHVVTVTANQTVSGRNFGLSGGTPTPSVVGRHIFYNNSAFDGRDPAAAATDDAAIATDKQALRPAESASAANYTNYSGGINGVMVDIANLPAGAAPSASDFVFAAGNTDDPSSWAAPSVEPTVNLRRGAGDNGSDRITLTWPDGTIVGKWLQVSVQATGNTGLSTPDVFYFGNLPGETFNSTSEARVTAADVLATRANSARAGAAVDNAYDFNRDRRVDVVDQAIARSRVGRSLVMFSQPFAFAAPVASQFSEVPVTAPRRQAYRPTRLLAETPASVV